MYEDTNEYVFDDPQEPEKYVENLIRFGFKKAHPEAKKDIWAMLAHAKPSPNKSPTERVIINTGIERARELMQREFKREEDQGTSITPVQKIFE